MSGQRASQGRRGRESENSRKRRHLHSCLISVALFSHPPCKRSVRAVRLGNGYCNQWPTDAQMVAGKCVEKLCRIALTRKAFGAIFLVLLVLAMVLGSGTALTYCSTRTGHSWYAVTS